jgi:hypothetical protein
MITETIQPKEGVPIKEFLKRYKEERDKIDNNPICHLVYTPFTGLGRPRMNGYGGDEWFKNRIEVFKKNTLKSLQNQTNQFFVHWISFRPEEQMNDLAKGLFSYLCGVKWRTIFTFGGLCWWDDKYRFDKLYQRLKDTLPQLKEIVGDASYVYETVLASDDMYHKDVMESISRQPFAYKRALVHWNGYLRDVKNDRLAEWKPPAGHLPPFYTIMYPADVFLDPKKHFEYLKGFKSHEDIERLFDCVRLPDGRYCVNVHGDNLSTYWNCKDEDGESHNHPYIGEEIKGEEKDEALKNFGL